KFIIIDGCRITFTSTFDLIGVTREYNTKGRKKTSTEGQIKKKGISADTPLPFENSDEDEWEEDIGEIVDKDFDFDEEAEWERIEKEEQEAEREKKELEALKGEIHHDKYEMIKTCLSCGISVYLAGPAGSGKNHTVEQIAKELGWNFYFSNSVQQEYKLTGFIDAGGDFHETEFYKACTDTEECIFFLDEIDASIPDVLVLLNAAIANGYFEFPNGRVDFDKVHFVAAGNTVGSGADDMYTGRMVLDQATLDRFAIIDFDYCELIEKKLTKNNKELIAFIHDLRKTAQGKGIRATFSYRCMMMVTKLEKVGMPLEDIMRIAVMKGLDKDTINTFQLFGTSKYYEALKKIQM
ncbi:MAG: AAA family ATPase, partial [Lachnospiraceae bacterium]|nr:AAA family ATPase [Lachnospiraceae bacterium]